MVSDMTVVPACGPAVMATRTPASAWALGATSCAIPESRNVDAGADGDSEGVGDLFTHDVLKSPMSNALPTFRMQAGLEQAKCRSEARP